MFDWDETVPAFPGSAAWASRAAMGKLATRNPSRPSMPRSRPASPCWIAATFTARDKRLTAAGGRWFGKLRDASGHQQSWKAKGGAPRHDGMAARRIGITLLAQTNATTRGGRLSSIHPKITATPLAKPRRIAVQRSKSTLRRMRRITLRLSPSSSRLLSSRPNMSSFETDVFFGRRCRRGSAFTCSIRASDAQPNTKWLRIWQTPSQQPQTI